MLPALVFFTLVLSGCSLPPENPLSRQDLARTNIYRLYQIEESPEAVLNALNRQGEVVLEGHYRQRPVYIKLLSTSEGIEVSHYNR
ncbi:hypothetical protein GFER_14580 [Geoalkalibacter ferrihydriticus DSM 17813]|uniref:Uncharacterized protein n=1 Tax=Geoalkalibacter ferrihydriticus DSM 17813 TaxID=1121915 RepID=A0A0C2EBA3_9BACT|nr:hypothetical protein GFER_14580 [Geoalkalibacter ferrihydriticus DSM 17813]